MEENNEEREKRTDTQNTRDANISLTVNMYMFRRFYVLNTRRILMSFLLT